MENLHLALGLLALQFVFLAYCVYNFNYINRERAKLKAELAQRLFLKNRLGTFDLPSCIDAMLTYHKLRLEGTHGVKVVKE